MIAFIGTGVMGAPMARNTADAGLDVRVWNRTREKAEPLAEHGIEVAASAEEAVHGADVVVTMLADGPAVEAAMEDGGTLAAMPDDAVWLQMSTVGIAATEALAALAEERGVAFVDAPVLGTRKPAEDGAVVIVGSGPDEARPKCDPIFEAVGSKTLWLGPAGAGSRAKLVLNSWVLSLTEAIAETIGLAEALDVDPQLFLDSIAGGPLDSGYAQLKGGAMIEREFPLSFALELALKDARLVIDAAERQEHAVPVMRAVEAQMAKAVEAGHGDKDMAATYLASRP